MTVIKCPECGKEAHSEADVCPNCGYQIKDIKKSWRIGCFSAIVVFIIIIIIIIATLPPDHSNNDSTSITLENKEETQQEDIKTDFEIIMDKSNYPYKRAVEVRLNERASRKKLKKLAYFIKLGGEREYERTFISYYLPDMKVGRGAWATSHFDPDLKVKILGATYEEKESISESSKQKSIEKNKDIIGKWFYDIPYASHSITLYRKDNKIYMYRNFKDGSSGTHVMTLENTPKGKKYQEVGEEEEYYLINSKGNLEIWDSAGLIGTAKKIKE